MSNVGFGAYAFGDASFGGELTVLSQLAKVSIADATVTGMRLLDRTDIRVVESDSTVTGVTLVEWPT